MKTVYTDSETWAGKIHPVQALREYRQETGVQARLIVVGMTSNGFTIADPEDAGMPNVGWFSTNTQSAISDFITQTFRHGRGWNRRVAKGIKKPDRLAMLIGQAF